MANNQSSSSTGIGFFGLLTIVFITLKLTKVIDWSWLWILSPIWMPIAVALFVAGILILVAYRNAKKKNLL